MENPPFEDVFPIQDGDIPWLCLFTGGYSTFTAWISSESQGGKEYVQPMVDQLSPGYPEDGSRK